MAEKDRLDIGGPGIDTQYERDIINYRPKVNYIPSSSKIDTSGLSADTASQLEKIADSSIAPLWNDVVTMTKKISEVEKKLSEKLAKSESRVSDKYKDMVAEAAKRFNYDIIDTIPFELYKATFNYPESSEAVLIQDLYEDYQADVMGELNAELYPDIVEIQQDWNDTLSFVTKGLYAQVLPIEDVPSTDEEKEDHVEIIREAESKLLNTYINLMKVDLVNQDIMKHMLLNEYGTENFYKISDQLERDKMALDRIEKRINTKAEVTGLVVRKMDSVSDATELISNTIDFYPYSTDKYDIVYHLLRQYKGKESLVMGLRKMQAVLKLSVDKKKAETNKTRSGLRGIAGRNTKRKINNGLVNSIHLRNEVFSEVYETMEYFDAIPDIPSFNVVADHIADGIQQSESMYRDQASDFYKIHAMESDMRSDKLKMVINKDAGRQVYRIIDDILNHIEATNSFPDESNLGEWVNEFMEKSKN